MRYSTLLLAALPLVAAAPVNVVTSMVYEYVTVTINEAGQVVTSSVASTVSAAVNDVPAAAPIPTTTDAPVPPPSSVPTVAPTVAPVVNAAVSVPSVASSSAASTSDSSASSGGGCGCPGDSSAPTSPGINGNPAKSVLDSTNCIRRMYNSNAVCLKWSPSLASASQECADDKTESNLRAGSTIVSDPSGYGGAPWYTGSKATTEYESSMFTLLCQLNTDPILGGMCAGKVGEDGCSSGACVGHRDALIDAAGQFTYLGVGMAGSWVSSSFSNMYSV